MSIQEGHRRGSRSEWTHPALLLSFALCFLIVAGLMVACGPASPSTLQTPSPRAEGPTVTRTPVPLHTATEPPKQSTGEPEATIAAGAPPTTAPAVEGGLPWDNADVGVLSLQEGSDGAPLRAAYSQDMDVHDPALGHFVAIYGHDGEQWQEIDRVVLTSCTESVGTDSLVQVEVEPSRIWLEMMGGAGAHGGCYDLLSFDGAVLRPEVSHQHSSPGAGWLEDLNADGILEVILDETDNYVFCYACGLRYPGYQVLRWNGEHFIEVELSELGQEAPVELQSLNNRAIALARAGLWKDAQSTMGEALRANIQDPELAATAAWNKALIDLHASATAQQATSGIYPLLESAIYGDYDAAVETMRPFSMQEIWGPETPLVAGTAAEGWEFELTERLSHMTNLALTEEPDLAPALFLRGWSAHLRDPGAPQAVADVERAFELAPDDPLYSESAAHLQVPISIAPPGEPRAFQPLPPETCYDLGQAVMQTLGMTVTLAEEPFDDPLRGTAGAGCQSKVTGTGADFDNQITVAAQVKKMLEGQGWTEDVMYAADGPTDSATAFQRNGALCLLSAGWSPADGANCPTGQPISACNLAPEQQLYTILLNCAREDVPGTPAVLAPVPTMTPMPSATPTPSAAPKPSATPLPSDTPPPSVKERWVVRTLLAGPGEPGRLYVLQVDELSAAWPAASSRILMSDDYGETWKPFPGGLPAEDCVRNINLD